MHKFVFLALRVSVNTNGQTGLDWNDR